jgi:succinyl-CoA synthetase beta subunit
MNLHEYQAKELLKKYNVPVQEGIAVDNVMAAEEAYRQMKTQTGNSFAVVKAQYMLVVVVKERSLALISVVWLLVKVWKTLIQLPKIFLVIHLLQFKPGLQEKK